MSLRWMWLALAVWGAVHPMAFFIRYMRAHEGGLSALIDAWYVNDSTRGLTWDLTIAAMALTLWIVTETARTRDWRGLLAIPATFCIGVSCGLPLFLFFRAAKA